MDEATDPRQRLEQLEAKKRELVEKIKAVNSSMRARRDEIVKLVPSLRGKAWLRGEKTKSEVDHIEFEISTTAYTPAQERLMLKRLKKAQGEMDQAMKLDGMRGKVEAARLEMEKDSKLHAEIDAELKKVREGLDAVYKEILAKNKEQYDKNRQKQHETAERHHAKRRESEFRQRRGEHEARRKEELKELEPYMKPVDSFVPLEEIAEIKRKPKQEAATE